MNYDTLVNLMVKDKLKLSMRPNTREKMREYSFGVPDQTFYDIAIVADEYEVDKPIFEPASKNAYSTNGGANATADKPNGQKPAQIDCWRCKSKHEYRNCPLFVPKTETKSFNSDTSHNQSGSSKPQIDINRRLENIANGNTHNFF